LNVYVLNAFNVHISETDVKESSDANWMSMKLKEKITVVLLIKSMFIWNVKNQSVRNQKITQNEKNLWKEIVQKVQCVIKNQGVRD